MNNVMEVMEAMRDWFQANRQEDVGLLSAGKMPHEQFFAQHGLSPMQEPVIETFVNEMLLRQPHGRVSGAQAYRYLRTAVMQHFVVDQAQWPNYR